MVPFVGLIVPDRGMLYHTKYDSCAAGGGRVARTSVCVCVGGGSIRRHLGCPGYAKTPVEVWVRFVETGSTRSAVYLVDKRTQQCFFFIFLSLTVGGAYDIRLRS